MNDVTAKAIFTEVPVPSDATIFKLDYTQRQLSIYMDGDEHTASVIIKFTQIIGFRVLDERDMMEYWPTCSNPNGWMFQIAGGGWFSQEIKRKGSCIGHMYPDADECLVTSIMECVSVICHTEPIVVNNIRPKRTELN